MFGQWNFTILTQLLFQDVLYLSQRALRKTSQKLPGNVLFVLITQTMSKVYVTLFSTHLVHLRGYVELNWSIKSALVINLRNVDGRCSKVFNDFSNYINSRAARKMCAKVIKSWIEVFCYAHCIAQWRKAQWREACYAAGDTFKQMWHVHAKTQIGKLGL